ncbi:MAG: hypothetical protein PHH48_06430 [Eubacteriales bacterium]|nr:hypothetical protein [Eubacteriales bacterium]
MSCGQVTVQAQGRVSLQKFLTKRGIKTGDEIEVFFRIPLKKQYDVVKELVGDLYVDLHSDKLGSDPEAVMISKDQCTWIDVTDMTEREVKNIVEKLMEKKK